MKPDNLHYPGVEARLKVTIREGTLWARLMIENRSDRPVHLLRYNVPISGELGNDAFVIEDASGGRAKFRGRLLKRPAPTAADAVVVPPGAQAEFVVDLGAHYALAQSPQLSIQYRAFHLDFDATEPELFLVESAPVVVTA